MSQRKVLLIDYEPRSIEDTRRPLVDAGFHVEVAQDGVSGLEAFRRLRPDIVVIEAMLPKKHGFDVCQEIKRSEEGRHTPVVITTGVYRGRRYRNQALQNFGCDEYLEKPFTDDALLTACNRIIAATMEGDRRVAQGAAPSGSPIPTEPSTSATATEPPADASTDASASNAQLDLEQLSEEEISARLDALLADFDRAVDQAVPSTSEPTTDGIGATASEPPLAAPGSAEPPRGRPEARAEGSPNPAASEPGEASVVANPDVAARRSRAEQAAAAPVERRRRPADRVTSQPSSKRWLFVALVPILLGGAAAAYFVLSGRASGKEESSTSAVPERSAAFEVPTTTFDPGAVASKPVPGVRDDRPSAIDLEGQRSEEPSAVSAGGGVPDAPAPSRLERETPSPSGTASRAAPQTASPESGSPGRRGARESSSEAVVADEKPVPPPAVERRADPAPATIGHSATASTTSTPPPSDAPASEPVSETSIASPTPSTGSRPDPTEVAPSSTAAMQPAEPAPPRVRRGDLVELSEVDQAPVAVTKIAPRYPAQARRMRQQGTVRLNVLIDETGSVIRVEVVDEIPRSVLNDTAVEAVRSWTYRPAVKDGVAVRVWKPEAIRFDL